MTPSTVKEQDNHSLTSYFFCGPMPAKREPGTDANSATRILQARSRPEVTFGTVEREIRKRSYGILSTTSFDGRPHSAGVMYGITAANKPLSLHIVTDRRSKKARNVQRNPNVSFVIPIPRRIGFLPPSSIQFQGTAEIIPLTDQASRDAFNQTLVLRRVLKLQLAQKQEVSAFIRIRPDPTIFTYGIGITITRLMRHVEEAAARVEIPSSC